MEKPFYSEDPDQLNSIKVVNHGLGQIIAVMMGLGICYINLDHGLYLASVAGLKQYVYSTFAAALFIELQHKTYDSINANTKDGSILPAVASIAVPAIGTSLATYIWHALPGTAETNNSTLPTLLLSPLGYSITYTRIKISELEKDFEEIFDTLDLKF